MVRILTLSIWILFFASPIAHADFPFPICWLGREGFDCKMPPTAKERAERAERIKQEEAQRTQADKKFAEINRCKTDNDCTKIKSGACAIKNSAIAKSIGEIPSSTENSGCRCQQGPTLYGCVPAKSL